MQQSPSVLHVRPHIANPTSSLKCMTPSIAMLTGMLLLMGSGLLAAVSASRRLRAVAVVASILGTLALAGACGLGLRESCPNRALLASQGR
jgi:hypothetical protein